MVNQRCFSYIVVVLSLKLLSASAFRPHNHIIYKKFARVPSCASPLRPLFCEPFGNGEDQADKRKDEDQADTKEDEDQADKKEDECQADMRKDKDQSGQNEDGESFLPDSSLPPNPIILRDPMEAVVLRPGLDLLTVSSLVIAQSLLFGLALLLYRFVPALGSPGSFPFIAFDKSSLLLGIQLSLPLTVAGAIFDRLPLSYPQQVLRSTKIFVLRLLGRSTPNLTAFITALVVAAFAGNKKTTILMYCKLLTLYAGVSEEFFFRGFVTSLIANYTNSLGALAASSVIFGVAHYPFFFGAASIMESILGTVFYILNFL